MASLYNLHLPAGWPLRDEASLKLKFLGLKKTRKPTEDPDCLEEVRKAKRVFRMLEARCAVAILHDDYGSRETEEESHHEPEAMVSATLATVNITADLNDHDGEMEVDSADSFVEQAVRDTTLTPPPAPPDLRATPRSGLSPSELASHFNSTNKTALKPNRQAPPALLSQTTQRRIRLDSVLDSLAHEPQPANNEHGLVEMIMIMEQRQAAREAAVRRELEECEVARDEREKLIVGNSC